MKRAATKRRLMGAVALGSILLLSLPAFTEWAGARNAGPGHRAGGSSTIRTMQRKDLYRPRVKLVSPREDIRTRDTVIPLVIDYVVQVGFVGAVDVYVGGRKLATYPVAERRRKGRLQVMLDLGPCGPGTHSVRVGGRQGLPGKQALGRISVRGVKVTIGA